ncbi:thiamine pyrophosphokinase [Anaerovibrio sp. JC8]|uniref:thiamine diphosphokinase n=1 Tax=Anaerovibrio sp. JC8 TaxID=1240085 RepID=UPI000A0BD9E9|nr:thiamine diphosphokinase [Anaerovibrio sp. JC8]ORU00204.1 thiamine pyrophosphokinase [Anaerovibrio sp. JC8]
MISKIKLPGMTIEYTGKIPDNQLVLVGGGRQPDRQWLKTVATDKELWCIDHGMDICHELGLVPKYLLGDFDSCASDSLTWAEDHGAIIERFNPQKDFTDTQAALAKAKEDDHYTILTGALGKRFDHTYSTVYSFGYSGIKGCIADEQETVLFLHDGETISITLDHNPKAISLLPITDTMQGVTTRGLYWELKDAELTQSRPYAVSNIPAHNTDHTAATDAGTFTVSIAKGILALYICQTE